MRLYLPVRVSKYVRPTFGIAVVLVVWGITICSYAIESLSDVICSGLYTLRCLMPDALCCGIVKLWMFSVYPRPDILVVSVIRSPGATSEGYMDAVKFRSPIAPEKSAGGGGSFFVISFVVGIFSLRWRSSQ